jgi:hypothetical protein
VTLHVGAGTFLPVKADDTADHKMHSEWGEVSSGTADALNAVRAAGGRIVCVGTTSLRLLESATGEDGLVRPFHGDTAIFITPGYRFRAADVLMTNFHLPKSTLFMLVSRLRRAGDDEGRLRPRYRQRLPLLLLRRREPADPARLRGLAMHYLRTASFGGLFTVTFAVAASFQIVFSVLGLFLAVAAPGMFNMNGVPATSAVGAIGVLIFMLAFGLFINAAMSALGALIVMAWRNLLPKPAKSDDAASA